MAGLRDRLGIMARRLSRGAPERPWRANNHNLLAEPDSAVLVDAEVPREGVRVRRVPVLARRVDGGYERWIARRVGVGKAEGASGLGFDVAQPRRPG
jgi:hypothetical protein